MKSDGVSGLSAPDGSPKQKWSRILMWTLLALTPIAPVAAAVIPVWISDEPAVVDSAPQCALPTSPGPVACIDTPRDRDEVSREFTVTGKLSNIPPDSHVWVATQIGNLVWPKQPDLTIGPAFNVTVVEGGNPPEGKFSIVLLLVTQQGQQMIDAWLGGPGGLPGLSLGRHSGDITPLATVSDLRLR